MQDSIIHQPAKLHGFKFAYALPVAVLFGQRQRLPDEIQENFTRSSAGHLMAA